MITIWKYPLRIISEPQEISFPGENGKVSLVAVQNGVLCLWIVVDTSGPETIRRFQVVGTEHELPKNAKTLIGGVQMGPFVWHVVELL
jgi:hypothetical protein